MKQTSLRPGLLPCSVSPSLPSSSCGGCLSDVPAISKEGTDLGAHGLPVFMVTGCFCHRYGLMARANSIRMRGLGPSHGGREQRQHSQGQRFLASQEALALEHPWSGTEGRGCSWLPFW